VDQYHVAGFKELRNKYSIAQVLEYRCDCAVHEAALFVEVAREPDQDTLHGNDPQL
jgi:hypothetical protein